MKVELDGLKKQWALSVAQKRALLAPTHSPLRVRRPWALLGLARSTLYDQPLGDGAEPLQRMRWLDAPYTGTPVDGGRRMTAWWRPRGDAVNPTRVSRRLRMRGLAAWDSTPRLRQSGAGHTSDPARLRGVTVDRVTQVWRAAITDLRLQAGLVERVAVRDGFSRSGLSGAISSTRDVACGLEALDRARTPGRPELFKTDHGVQCTRQVFTARLREGGLRLRMEGRGRALDPGLVARLWRSVQEAAVDLRDDHTVGDARHGLAHSVAFDHEARLPQALGDRPPAAVYRG